MNNIKEIIQQEHKGDEKQLEFIFSQEKRILVEAAAGYGKTKSMVSKIAYLIATNEIPNPKRILALTFSVNAAYKIKKEVVKQIPSLLSASENRNRRINKIITVSNFHGFCRRVLRIYGYLLHENLKEIDSFTSFGDNKRDDLTYDYSDTDVEIMVKFSEAVKTANKEYITGNINDYNKVILQSCIPEKKITYNAIISLTIQLFNENEEILKFYQKYFPIIIVDEFQDSNTLSMLLLDCLIKNENHTYYLIGDSLQRIYGFIGAVPNLMEKVERCYKMLRIEYTQNYRFKDNAKMLLLDKNVRLNAKEFNHSAIEVTVKVNFELLDTQQEEANSIVAKVKYLKGLDENAKIVVLFKNGESSPNTKKVLDAFRGYDEPFFYGLFADDNPEYIEFHKNCSQTFSDVVKGKHITKKMLTRFLSEMKRTYENSSTNTISSLIILLEAFIKKFIKDEMLSLEEEEKQWYIMETFDNLALKQSLEFVDAKVSIFTIHAAKGLEWDYAIIPDCENYALPSSYVCSEDKCPYENRRACSLKNVNNEEFEKGILEELSVFYVAFTRAKKDVFFSASRKGINKNGDEKSRNISCLLKLKGIDVN